MSHRYDEINSFKVVNLIRNPFSALKTKSTIVGKFIIQYNTFIIINAKIHFVVLGFLEH